MSLATKSMHAGQCVAQRCNLLETESFETEISHDHLENAD